MSGIPTLEVLDAAAADAVRPELASILVDCVAGGAGVSFLAPLDPSRADEFWRGVVERVACERCRLIVARDGGRVTGTVQLGLDTPQNQPHRADVRKLLVHAAHRRRGVGGALMTHVEAVAAAAGRSLLTLDTVTGSDAERLYERLGWNRAGTIPRYSLDANGVRSATTIFWKELVGRVPIGG